MTTHLEAAKKRIARVRERMIGRPRHVLNVTDTVRLYESGMSYRAIAKQYGVSKSLIWKRIHMIVTKRSSPARWSEDGRVCTKCGEWKVWEDYPLDKQRTTNRNPKCKACLRNYAHARYQQYRHSMTRRP